MSLEVEYTINEGLSFWDGSSGILLDYIIVSGRNMTEASPGDAAHCQKRPFRTGAKKRTNCGIIEKRSVGQARHGNRSTD